MIEEKQRIRNVENNIEIHNQKRVNWMKLQKNEKGQTDKRKESGKNCKYERAGIR